MSINILQEEWIKAMPIQGLVWTYQITTTAVEVDEQIDRLRATSNDNLALSFPKTQA